MNLINNCLFVLGAIAIYYFLFMTEQFTNDKLKRGGTKHFDADDIIQEEVYGYEPIPKSSSKWFSRKKDLQQANKWY